MDAPWPDIPERYGTWKTIYDRSAWWRHNGNWNRILRALQTKLSAAGVIDWAQQAVDGTIMRAHRSAAGTPTAPTWDGADEPSDHALGRSVGGFSTKIHVLSDGNGLPLDAMVTPRQTYEQCERVLEHVVIRRRPRKYEQLALNYLGLVKLAFIERYLRLLTRFALAV